MNDSDCINNKNDKTEQMRRGSDIRIPLFVELEDIYNGNEYRVCFHNISYHHE